MKLIIDSANIRKIQEHLSYLPIEGVTTNPSILKKEGKIDFLSHVKEIKEIIGDKRDLHVQTISSNYRGMVEEAFQIVNNFGENTYVKIPVTKDGLQAIRVLKDEKINVTATAIYNEMQALLALEMGADFLAPYVNRMENLNTNPYELIENVTKVINKRNNKSNILAASFKNISQVTKAINYGAEYVTVGVDLIDNFLSDRNIDRAVEDFAEDWSYINPEKRLF